MRDINLIVIHCASTKPSMDIGAKEIDSWHRERGFFKIGYHYVIRRDGTVETGRELAEGGAHAQGFNARSIGICLVGGMDEKGKSANNFTPAQWDALQELVTRLREQFPEADVKGHRDLPEVHKDCPCFDVSTWMAKTF